MAPLLVPSFPARWNFSVQFCGAQNRRFNGRIEPLFLRKSLPCVHSDAVRSTEASLKTLSTARDSIVSNIAVVLWRSETRQKQFLLFNFCPLIVGGHLVPLDADSTRFFLPLPGIRSQTLSRRSPASVPTTLRE